MKKPFDSQPTIEPAAVEKIVRLVLRTEVAKTQSEVLSLKQVGELLHLKRRAVARLIREDGLPVRYVSERKSLVLRSELLAWLQTRKVLPETEEESRSDSNPITEPPA